MSLTTKQQSQRVVDQTVMLALDNLGGQARHSAIRDATPYSGQTVSQALRRLLDSGQVESPRRGWWVML